MPPTPQVAEDEPAKAHQPPQQDHQQQQPSVGHAAAPPSKPPPAATKCSRGSPRAAASHRAIQRAVQLASENAVQASVADLAAAALHAAVGACDNPAAQVQFSSVVADFITGTSRSAATTTTTPLASTGAAHNHQRAASPSASSTPPEEAAASERPPAINVKPFAPSSSSSSAPFAPPPRGGSDGGGWADMDEAEAACPSVATQLVAILTAASSAPPPPADSHAGMEDASPPSSTSTLERVAVALLDCLLRMLPLKLRSSSAAGDADTQQAHQQRQSAATLVPPSSTTPNRVRRISGSSSSSGRRASLSLNGRGVLLMSPPPMPGGGAPSVLSRNPSSRGAASFMGRSGLPPPPPNSNPRSRRASARPTLSVFGNSGPPSLLSPVNQDAASRYVFPQATVDLDTASNHPLVQVVSSEHELASNAGAPASGQLSAAESPRHESGTQQQQQQHTIRESVFNSAVWSVGVVADDAAVPPPDATWGHTVCRQRTQYTRTVTQVGEWGDSADYPELNQYVLLDTLGTGSQGTVYLAMDTDANEFRALKAIRRPRRLAGGHGLRGTVEHRRQQMLQHEVEVLARCRHPNVVALYEVIDCDSHDFVYLVMQYVPHEALGAVDAQGVRTTPAPGAQQLLSIALQVIAGLQYLHDHGVTHRDIKPDNILVGPESHVFITDFGVAELRGKQQQQTLEEPSAAATDGTMAFMAPELITTPDPNRPTSSHQVTAAIDVWALGVTLYLLYFGRLPFCPKQRLNAFILSVQQQPIDFGLPPAAGWGDGDDEGDDEGDDDDDAGSPNGGMRASFTRVFTPVSADGGCGGSSDGSPLRQLQQQRDSDASLLSSDTVGGSFRPSASTATELPPPRRSSSTGRVVAASLVGGAFDDAAAAAGAAGVSTASINTVAAAVVVTGHSSAKRHQQQHRTIVSVIEGMLDRDPAHRMSLREASARLRDASQLA